ncbi:MAG: hypothetical protein J7L32_05320 [Thermoplasmata archaeon]|nr:hypothetical protein [Thermoplasmata archaeon]
MVIFYAFIFLLMLFVSAYIVLSPYDAAEATNKMLDEDSGLMVWFVVFLYVLSERTLYRLGVKR